MELKLSLSPPSSAKKKKKKSGKNSSGGAGGWKILPHSYTSVLRWRRSWSELLALTPSERAKKLITEEKFDLLDRAERSWNTHARTRTCLPMSVIAGGCSEVCSARWLETPGVSALPPSLPFCYR